jgi:hypothetical protein
MKSFISMWATRSLVMIITLFAVNAASAQNTKSEKKAKKLTEVKNMVDSKDYVFVAQYVNPQRGGQHYLTSEYDFNVGKDSLVAYLPYFGRAYVAPINPEDASMIFTATHFEYKTTEKKDGWDVSIKPKDAKDVNAMRLNIYKDGNATLQIISNNREAISYMGYIEVKKKKV